MIRTTASIFISIFSIFCFTFSYGQNFTLSGYVEDADTGETLIGVNLFNEQNSLQGTTTNVYGFYSLSLPAGLYNLKVSYLSSGVTMEEVVVIGEEEDKNISSTEMGTLSLPVDKIKKLPALLGEVDILKTLQLLPGVLSAGEGTAGFYVRGGGPDQNLVLLDEAVVYNSGHLLGFFSVFNADAIKNTTLIKGGIPANYGFFLADTLVETSLTTNPT